MSTVDLEALAMRCEEASGADNALDPDADKFGHAFMLGEFGRHLAEVRDGKHTWEEFGEAKSDLTDAEIRKVRERLAERRNDLA